jgi:starch phosphorylase
MVDTYRGNKAEWNRMSLMNIAGAGFFAADRSIEEYAQRIWGLEKIK